MLIPVFLLFGDAGFVGAAFLFRAICSSREMGFAEGGDDGGGGDGDEDEDDDDDGGDDVVDGDKAGDDGGDVDGGGDEGPGADGDAVAAHFTQGHPPSIQSGRLEALSP